MNIEEIERIDNRITEIRSEMTKNLSSEQLKELESELFSLSMDLLKESIK